MHVTVLMAVYNGVPTVQDAIQGVLGQTHRDLELLVVDDGSTDETPAIIKAASGKDPRVRVISNERNLGFPAALNVGWRAAQYDLIALNDADDVSLPTRIEKQVRFMQEHPEVDVLGTGAILVDRDGHELREILRPESHEELVQRMYKENPFIHPSVMFRRRFLEALGGYDPRLRRAQDSDLCLRGYRQFRYHNLPCALIRYTTRAKPRWDSTFWAAFVTLRAAWREGLLLTKGWYALVGLGTAVTVRCGLYTPRTLRRPPPSSHQDSQRR